MPMTLTADFHTNQIERYLWHKSVIILTFCFPVFIGFFFLNQNQQCNVPWEVVLSERGIVPASRGFYTSPAIPRERARGCPETQQLTVPCRLISSREFERVPSGSVCAVRGKSAWWVGSPECSPVGGTARTFNFVAWFRSHLRYNSFRYVFLPLGQWIGHAFHCSFSYTSLHCCIFTAVSTFQ